MSISEAHTSIANNLASRHGNYRLANERSGVIAYMACPVCLETKGRQEFESRHMAVMLDFWLKNNFNTVVAKCMRCDRKFKKKELLSWPTLKERNFSDHSKVIVTPKKPKPVILRDFLDGVEIPYDPGQVIPISELPKNHPAWQYLLSRETLDIDSLIRDFHPSFCIKERPESQELGIFYKKFPVMRITPQGRIIFYSFCNSHMQAWQSRLIDQKIKINGGELTSILHPDTNQFVPVSFNNGDTITYIPPVTSKSKIPPKYYNGRFHKHKILFGYDSYLNNNKNIPYEKRVIFVAEGLLDAVQVGGDGVACLGKQICQEQVPLLLSLSPKIVFMVQNDEPSETGFKNSKEFFDKINVQVFRVSPPENFNDFGEMHHSLVKQYVSRFYS